MKTIVSCRQMKELDRHTIEDMGVPSLVLMERAALSVVEELVQRPKLLKRVLVVCGAGNNGGDGFAIARLLHLKGYRTELYFPGNPQKATQETKIQMDIAEKYGVPSVNNPAWDEYTTIVDAIFGVGLSRNIEGKYADIIAAVNRSPASVAAVDIPSGINGDNGQVMGCAVRADVTVTFAFGKKGQYLYPGAAYCGRLLVKDIGIYEKEDEEPEMSALEEADLCLLPSREGGGNKATFGKVLAVAGSFNMAGAAYLCAKAVLAAGAGMVKIHTVEENRCILQQLLPEALLYTDRDDWKEAEWQANLDWADVVVLGPGLGRDERALHLAEFYLKSCRKPLVLDADGLNLLADHPQLWQYASDRWILTPHPGEFSRLSGKAIPELVSRLEEEARAFALSHGVHLAAKDARTVTVTADGRTYLNTSGNDGMATAGSGDVLSGILGGLLAQKMEVALAAPFGVYLHGLAGDAAKSRFGRRSMTSSQIIDGLTEVLRRSEEGSL